MRPLCTPAVIGACALLASIVAPPTAQANPYESFISIENDDDLYDLQSQQAITDDTFNQLLDLLDRGVDLNTADRAALYELPNLTYDEVDGIIKLRELEGRIRDPAQLVTTGVLSQEKLYAIAAFLTEAPARDNPLNAHGFVRMLARSSIKDRDVPATSLRGRVSALSNWNAGFAGVFTRLRLGDAQWDPTRKALIADAASLRFEVPKVFARYKTDTYDAIVGSYRVGFGQRLVFDNTNSYNPNGLMTDDQLFFDSDLTRSCKESQGELATKRCDTTTAPYVTPDFRWRDGLFGAAGGAKHIPLGDGWMQLYGWASYSRRGIYQYELVNRGVCADPNDDSDPNCAAPNVYRKPDGTLLSPASRFSFSTLPNIFGEVLGGANATYYIDRRTHVGVTGYGAYEQQLVGGVDLDTQEYSRIPTGRSFGAIGANVAFGHKWLDVFGEVAYSLDKSPDPTGPINGGGGPAVIVRATATQKDQEVEASLRYYSINFANPYARPLAAPDEVNGQRARDEVGGRIRHQWVNKRLALRSYVDFWVTPSTSIPKLDAWFRADVRATSQWRWGSWIRVRDKDLRETGRGQCYEISTENDENGEPIPCKGQQLTAIGRVSYEPNKKLNTTLQAQHDWVDDPIKHPTKYRHDVSAWLVGLYKPTKEIRVRVRGRYRFEDIFDNTYLEQTLAMYTDVSMKVRRRDTVRVRFDANFFLDDRASTAVRSPNPELSVWLGYEARY